jgi:hypothetical protein
VGVTIAAREPCCPLLTTDCANHGSIMRLMVALHIVELTEENWRFSVSMSEKVQ